MNTFLVYVGDDNFCRVLPEELDRSKSGNGRGKRVLLQFKFRFSLAQRSKSKFHGAWFLLHSPVEAMHADKIRLKEN